MPSERVQRQIDRLLDEAEQAITKAQWSLVPALAAQVLALDPDNTDALTFIAAAERMAVASLADAEPRSMQANSAFTPKPAVPASFVSGRYAVKKFLGEGGKKRVYLAHDTLLDRDVAFALIKTEGLDEVGRQRITREAQAMGRLGAHPHIVSVFDLGEEDGQPYIVTELMGGGDVEGLLEKAPEHRPPLERTLEVGIAVCRGLEFAHGQGIVHRDLKPGNVWLTADGTAKLGDFGLAVALDKSRLTQGGMMVGTVSYMPPEQAMGGEVTHRADLYSLGAMLYEMVTGRPPFVGDESVAIITQHLNVAPVAPSWHNPAVPPGLEALILRLLEKDPAKRPALAADVRAMLEGMAATNLSSQPPSPREKGENGSALSSAAPTNPLYRRAFVGREAELRQLQAAFDAALSGQGGLVMVVGEPGIGKTSIIEQLVTYTAIRSGKALVGHCYEEGSLSLPYLPFVEAMRSYVLAREPEGLKSDLGSGAADVARIVSEVRDRLSVEARPSGDPEDDRWRLLQAVTSFLRNASLVQPLLLVLEDLHDADRGTLDLLVHVARNLEGTRLLIAGTYRDVEVDRQHPLSGTLADLRRINTFRRVPLRGLTANEVLRMMAAVAQREVSWPFAELVHRQTEGNPLFVQEMLRYLVEEGLVAEQGNALRRVGDDSLAGRIPEGLRDVIGKRLSRLSEKTNQVLSIAAVIGRDFRVDVLERVSNLPEEEVEQALEQAQDVAVLEQRQDVGSIGFRFTHAFFRQTLYEEIFVPRRIRWHQQVARALVSAYGRRAEEHAAELSEHFAQTTDREDLEQALHYLRVAAERATMVYAYTEAERHLSQALKVQEVLDPDDAATRCDLLLALGATLLPVGEPQRVAEAVAPAAFGMAERLGDRRRCFASAQLALTGFAYTGAGLSLRTPIYREWVHRADRYAEPGTIERVRADVYLGMVRWTVGKTREGLDYGSRALGLARELHDPSSLFFASALVAAPVLPGLSQERTALVTELEALWQSGVTGWEPAVTRATAALTLLSTGDRERAETLFRDAAKASEQTRDVHTVVWTTMSGPILATLDGRLEDALLAGGALQARGEALGSPAIGRRFARTSTRTALLYLGRAAEALEQLDVGTLAGEAGWDERADPLKSPEAALCFAHLDRRAEAASILEMSLTGPAPLDLEELSIIILTWLLEAAVLIEDGTSAALVRQRLEPAAGVIAIRVATIGTCIARHLGAASALLGEPEQARAYYDQALEVAGKVRFRPEIALTHLGIAELLLAEATGNRQQVAAPSGSPAARSPLPAAAIAHLDFAIAEFREMKMQPALERALRHKEVLKA